MVNWSSKRLSDGLLLANGLVLAVLLNLFASKFFFRVDLTEEKRYTMKEPTIEMLQQLDDLVLVEVFLEGDLNAGFKRLQRSTREMLEEFRIRSGNKVQFVFTDPASATGQKAQNEFMQELMSKGIQPMNVIDNKGSEQVQQLVFPGALVSYGGLETSVNLLKGNRAQGSQEILNQSVENLEFELASAIQKLSNVERKRIGMVTGHGELDSLSIASFNNALLDQYDVFKVDLDRKEQVENYDLLILLKPTRPFTEADKFKLDQYVMKGGRLLMLLDRLDASIDSASQSGYYAFPYNTNLDDMLFRYGVRINLDLIQDKRSLKQPVVTGAVGGQPQIVPIDWPFFPLANKMASHPITRNLDAVSLKFVSSMDTVKAEGVRKTALIYSSNSSRVVGAPVAVNVDDLKQLANLPFQSEGFVAAYLLEGTFTSVYRNRFVPEGVTTTEIVQSSVPTKIIVVSDGDLARNEINYRTGQPQQLGFDPVFGHRFANEELLLNMVAWLVDEDGLINARTKEFRIRPLDKRKIVEDKLYWQLMNLLLPLLLVVALGVGRSYWRKRKFAVK
ncbi:MAG: gliding motility-associated ABC transporter substrate-binding protein GldG [Cyclobacteriaceae bacterium]